MSRFNRFIFLIVLAASTLKLSSQGTVKGKVLDSLKVPVGYAIVGLYNSGDSSLQKGVYTNPEGEYLIPSIRKGSYFLKSTVMNTGASYSPIFTLDSLETKVLPDILLHKLPFDLDEITVTTLKNTFEFKNGNITVNVEDSPLAAGNTAYDLFSKLPGVSVDEINNSISIQGREGVKIMIDGRAQQLSGKQLINLLKSISASTVEKIEVLKNPPVRYDAAGTAGIINIRMKRSKVNGVNGTLSSSGTQGFYPRGESALSFNYRQNKILLFLDLTSEYGIYQSVNNFNRKINQGTGISSINTKHIEKNGEAGGMLNIGLDWYVNRRNTFGVKITEDMGQGTGRMAGNALVGGNTSYERMNYSFLVKNYWSNINYNINAEHAFDTAGTILKLTVDYSPNFETIKGEYNHRFLIGDNETLFPKNFRSSIQDLSGILSAKADFEKDLTSWLSIETGAKASRESLAWNYTVDQQNPIDYSYSNDTLFTNGFVFKQDITAAYLQLGAELQNMEMNVGLRAENTSLKGEGELRPLALNRTYFNLFPTADMDLKLGSKHNLQFSYNRRINRPEFYALNPYKLIPVNILLTEKGNSNLKPEFSNTMELTHSYAKKISQSFAFSSLSNYIMEYTLQNDTTGEITGYIANLNKSNTYAYTLFFEVPFKNKMKLNGNLSAYYNTYKGNVNGQSYNSGGLGYNGSITNEWLLQRHAKLELNFQYLGPAPMGIFTIQSRWSLNTAVKFSFLKDKLDVVFGVNDLFYTFIGKNRVNFGDQSWTISETNDTRRLKLSLSYNFGKSKAERRETGSLDSEREHRKR